MQSLIHDLRYALRMMQRNPGITAIAVLALGLGIGANSAVFAVLNGVLIRPLAFPEADRLLVLSNAPPTGPFGMMLGMVEGQYLELRGSDRASFDTPAMFTPHQLNLTGAGEPMRLQTSSVTPDFFAVLRVKPAMGRDFLEGEAQSPVVLLSDAIWRSRFGADPQIVGKAIKLDGVGHTVIGVMPAGLAFPEGAQLWTPLDVRVDPHRASFRPAVARLKAGRTREEAQAEFAAFARGLSVTQFQRVKMKPQVLSLKELLVGDIRESLRIFAGAVAFVLLIACANVANLLLMRAEGRRQEIAVRIALGAGRLRLVRQLLTESLLVSLLGGAVGILLALWGVPALLALAPKGRIPRMPDISIDAAVLAFTFGVSILTGLLFGAAPAFQAARRTVRDSLSQSARTSTGAGKGLRDALAVGEIALALVLLTGAGLMLKSLWRLHAVDPGFQPDRVLTMTVNLPDAVYQKSADMRVFHTRVLEKLAATHRISAVAAVNWLPLTGMLIKGDFKMQAGRFPENFAVDKLVVSGGYFRTMGIRILRGRDFSERDTPDAPPVVLISQAAARTLWPGEDPIGKQISESEHPKPGDWRTIAGVADDVRQEGLTKKGNPALYYPYLQSPVDGWLTHMTYVVRAAGDSSASELAPAMRAAVHAVDADQPIETAISMRDLMAVTGAERTFQARLLSGFAMLALALAAIGVYGVLAYAVAMRTREIGIRMALGAKAGDVLRMVMRRTAALAAGGLALGTAGALFATRVLEKMLFEVKPNDAATMIVMVCVLGAAAMAAGWVPARRAARVDPLVALRWE